MEGPMRDTYDSGAEAEADRTQQKALLAALGAWYRALRRDECGAWCISGMYGRIHASGNAKTWVFWLGCRSPLHWTYTKRRLTSCSVTQDAEEEGCLRLHALPTPDQADVIRDVLGIRKRTEISAETLERLRARTALWNGLEPQAIDDSVGQDGREAFGGTLTHPQVRETVFDAGPVRGGQLL